MPLGDASPQRDVELTPPTEAAGASGRGLGAGGGAHRLGLSGSPLRPPPPACPRDSDTEHLCSQFQSCFPRKDALHNCKIKQKQIK